MTENDKCIWVKNDDDLKKSLKRHTYVIALFYASWCPFCIKFLPIFEKYAEKSQQMFLIVQDDEESIADKYSVKVYPSVLFFENGEIADRLDGVLRIGLDEKQLIDFINSRP